MVFDRQCFPYAYSKQLASRVQQARERFRHVKEKPAPLASRRLGGDEAVEANADAAGAQVGDFDYTRGGLGGNIT